MLRRPTGHAVERVHKLPTRDPCKGHKLPRSLQDWHKSIIRVGNIPPDAVPVTEEGGALGGYGGVGAPRLGIIKLQAVLWGAAIFVAVHKVDIAASVADEVFEIFIVGATLEAEGPRIDVALNTAKDAIDVEAWCGRYDTKDIVQIPREKE